MIFSPLAKVIRGIQRTDKTHRPEIPFSFLSQRFEPSAHLANEQLRLFPCRRLLRQLHSRLPDVHVRFCLDDRGKTLAKDRMIFDTQHANGIKAILWAHIVVLVYFRRSPAFTAL
jgi:hypothetical protein